jgi:opacity protein-like surface antigen
MALILAAVWVLGLAASAYADSYFGIYGGGTFVPQTDIKNEAGTVIKVPKQQFRPGAVGGLKAGQFLKDVPWLATEFNIWGELPHQRGTGVHETLGNASLSLLAQLPVGPLRIYAGAGPVGTYARISGTAPRDHTWAAGAMAQAGAEYKATCNMGLFAEYRYVWTPLEFGVRDEKQSLARNIALAGINFHY